MAKITNKSKKTLNFNVVQEGKSRTVQLGYRQSVETEEVTDQIKKLEELRLIRLSWEVN